MGFPQPVDGAASAQFRTGRRAEPLLFSADQHHEGLGQRVGVREREQQAGGAAGGEKGAGLVIKLGDGFTFGAVEDPDAGQREFSADAGAKGLARCLLGAPDLIILDEPTRGIDIGAKAEIYALIQKLARAGKGILLASSELPEVLSLAHRIVVLRRGSVSATLDAASTDQETVLRHAMPL